MADVTIEATPRTGTGKSYTRKLRAAGKIPAILNGKGTSQMLELDPKLLSKAWKSEGHIFNLTIGGATKAAKITELQIDPVRRLPLHIDLSYVE